MSLPYRRASKRKEFIENWNLYLQFPKIFECHPAELPPIDINGDEGQYSFLCLENGIKIPTREWDLVKRVQEGKMSVNLQMKMWAEDLGTVVLFPEQLYEYCQGYPEWVYMGTMEQARSRIVKEIGFVPTFMKHKMI